MRTPVLIAMLASMMLFVGACQDDSVTPSEPSGFTQVAGTDVNTSCDPFEGECALGGDCECEPGCNCAWLVTPQCVVDDFIWDEPAAGGEGTISPGLGGFFHFQPSSWGPGVNFAIQVPPNALPPGVGPTDFTIRVPSKSDYLANQHLNCGRGMPLILDLEPHGLMFNEDVTVHVTYMPWTNMRATDCKELWSASPVFGVFELESVSEQRQKGGGYIVTASFKAPHFSRWEFGSCDEAPCPPPPG